jgi:hypothetical protein
VVLAAVLAIAPAVLQAQTPAQATGSLTANGVTTPLRFVYASAQPGFFDARTEDVRILLSDVELTDEERGDTFALIRRGRAGTAHVVEVVLDTEGAPIAGALYAPIFNGMLSATGMHQFTRSRFEKTIVAGRLQTRSLQEIDTITWSYEAEFSAPIARPRTREDSAAAAAGPAGRAAAAYLAAVRTGDLARLAGLSTRRAAAAFARSGASAELARRRTEIPPEASVVDVRSVSDTAATAIVQGHVNGLVVETELSVVLEGGAWKVDH